MVGLFHHIRDLVIHNVSIYDTEEEDDEDGNDTITHRIRGGGERERI